MADTLNFAYPPRWINAFVFDTLTNYEDVGISPNQKIIPIFAASPIAMEDTYRKLTETSNISDPLLIQYERLLKIRSGPFYPRKKEQVIYQVYSTGLAHVNNATMVISELLDREDASAQDLNFWCSKNPQEKVGEAIPYNVFFHSTRVYQINEAQQIYKPISNNPFYYTKIIIDYEYHSESQHK